MQKQKRSLFEKIFGKKKDKTDGKPFQFINTTSSAFYPWTNNLFDSDIVRSAIRPIATAIGKLNAKHIRGSDNIKINPINWIADILRQPNPYMSMNDFLTKMAFHRELTHNAFAYVVRDMQGNPFEIYPIPYSSVELLEISGDIYAKFRFWTGKYINVLYSDLIHLRKDFNSNDFYGDLGILVLKNPMEVITTTDQGVVNAVKNSAVIKWILKFKNVLKPEDKELQLKEFTKNYLDISNKGGAAATDPRFDVEQVNNQNYVPNALQMDKAVQRLYSYFGVNESIVQNKYNENEWLAFYESRIEPIIIQLSNEFTRLFFTKKQINLGNRIVFESSNLAYASMQTKLALVQMVDRGALTPNEWREVLNLAKIEGGDKPIRRLDTAEIGKEKDTGEDEDVKVEGKDK
ncbi:MAG: phage portal protein [Candidatus Nanoarchaeia archaeon]|nr:phage portal protein [Candidatus Nanoarchaeia archaeon]